MSLFTWLIDQLPSEYIVDAHFVMSDLKDLFISDEHLSEIDCGDSLSSISKGMSAKGTRCDRYGEPLERRVSDK